MVDEEYSLALVTGAAHRLGRAFALSLAQLGYAILLHYRTSEKQVEQAAADLRSVGVPVYQFGADLTMPRRGRRRGKSRGGHRGRRIQRFPTVLIHLIRVDGCSSVAASPFFLQVSEVPLLL
jgi:hypothetical protein